MGELKSREGPSTKGTQSNQFRFLSALIVSLSVIAYFIYGERYGQFVFITGTNSTAIIMMIAILAFSTVSLLIPEKHQVVKFYASSLALLVYLGLLLLSLHSIVMLIISIFSFTFYLILWRQFTFKKKGSFQKFITFTVALIFMYFVGDLLRFINTPADYPATVTWLGGLFLSNVSGTPLLMKYGIEVYAPYYAISISPVSFSIFVVVASLLTENYFSIFSLLRTGNRNTKIQGTAYGLISSLSCQCEGGISLLPTMAILLISITMVPLLLESLTLLFLTNYFINHHYIRNKRIRLLSSISDPVSKTRLIIPAAVLFIGTSVMEVTGIYLGLINNMLFFFGIGIVMTLTAYFETTMIGILLDYRKSLHPLITSVLSVTGAILMFIWYIPTLTLRAVEAPAMFVLMNITGIVAGALFGLVRLSVKKGYKQLLDEFIALMFGMPPIIVLYMSAMLQFLIWPEFGLLQQVEFGIMIWAAVLPFMWLSTNISLNDTQANSDSFAIPSIKKQFGAPYHH